MEFISSCTKRDLAVVDVRSSIKRKAQEFEVQNDALFAISLEIEHSESDDEQCDTSQAHFYLHTMKGSNVSTLQQSDLVCKFCLETKVRMCPLLLYCKGLPLTTNE